MILAAECSVNLVKKFLSINKNVWHQTWTSHPGLAACPFDLSRYFLFLTSKNSLKEYFCNFFLSIMLWLSEEVGFSYRVANWNKFKQPNDGLLSFYFNYIYIYIYIYYATWFFSQNIHEESFSNVIWNITRHHFFFFFFSIWRFKSVSLVAITSCHCLFFPRTFSCFFIYLFVCFVLLFVLFFVCLFFCLFVCFGGVVCFLQLFSFKAFFSFFFLFAFIFFQSIFFLPQIIRKDFNQSMFLYSQVTKNFVIECKAFRSHQTTLFSVQITPFWKCQQSFVFRVRNKIIPNIRSINMISTIQSNFSPWISNHL